MTNNQRCLIFDIETAPMLAYVWGLRDQNIATNQIKTDWHVMAWAAKWLGDPASKTMYRDQRNEALIHDDYRMLQPLWKLLNEADIVITQYGSGFDSPKLNARFITLGMKPPSPYKHLDTYRIVKRIASFTSNKLEYLTDKLNVKYKKLSHSKYPGMSLWRECLSGNVKAWDEMKKYNIHDVLSTEELYLKLRAWTPQSMTKITKDVITTACRTCGDSSHMRRKGIEYAKAYHYQKYLCTKCGSWTQGEKLK